MQKWEYMTEIVRADTRTRGIKEYLNYRWPDFSPAKFAPESLIPRMNSWGEEGWELVNMVPIPPVGDNFDISFPSGGTGTSDKNWSNCYFCVYKRPLGE